jgi:hypothetical protein
VQVDPNPVVNRKANGVTTGSCKRNDGLTLFVSQSQQAAIFNRFSVSLKAFQSWGEERKRINKTFCLSAKVKQVAAMFIFIYCGAVIDRRMAWGDQGGRRWPQGADRASGHP